MHGACVKRETEMRQPAYYRAQAAEFVEQAQDAKSPEHRVLLLRKAEIMVRMADQAELMERLVRDPDVVAVAAGPKPLSSP
jgi:hypothetical protein